MDRMRVLGDDIVALSPVLYELQLVDPYLMGSQCGFPTRGTEFEFSPSLADSPLLGVKAVESISPTTVRSCVLI